MTGGSPLKQAVDANTSEALRNFAIKVVPFFKHLLPIDLSVTTIKGGTTNQLYLLRNDSHSDMGSASPKAAVVRVYGKGTDKMISRNEELFWQGQFLETYGANSEMLCYEFLEGFRPLVAAEFYPRRHQIARRICAFHSKATQAAVFRTNNQNQTHVMLTKWIELITKDFDKTRSNISPAKLELFDRMGWGEGGLERERDWLLSVIAKNAHRLPVGVCHNDLTCGNFMVNEKKGQEELRFIDFEYTRNNYTYFDFGNHFCEYGGLECDFTKFPSREVIKEFLREYMEEGRKRSVIQGYVGMTSSSGNNAVNFGASPSNSKGASVSDTTTALESISGQSTPIPEEHPHNTAEHKAQQQLQQAGYLTVTEEEVEEAADLTHFFALISHFGWSLWGVIQEMNSEIDFGFMDYAWSRWEEYSSRKEEFSRNVA